MDAVHSQKSLINQFSGVYFPQQIKTLALQTLRHMTDTEFDVQVAQGSTHVHLTVLHAPARICLGETVRVLDAAVRCIGGLSGRACEHVRIYSLRKSYVRQI